MIDPNPAIVPTFLLACAWFVAGNYCHEFRPRLSLAAGVLMAIPCALAVFYYSHLFDNAIWYYELRTLPWIELAFSGVGFLGGAIHRWNDAETRVGRVTVPVVFAVILLIPFIKPILQPLDMSALTDKCAGRVCLQSSYATCGPASAATLLREYGKAVTERELATASYTYAGGTEIWYLARAIRQRGFEAGFVLSDSIFPFPSIAGVRMGGGHFIAIEKATEKAVTFVDPLTGESTVAPIELRARYRFTGLFLQVRPGGN
jgi:Peptidase C39 family